jgi:hypothetical protein
MSTCQAGDERHAFKVNAMASESGRSTASSAANERDAFTRAFTDTRRGPPPRPASVAAMGNLRA